MRFFVDSRKEITSDKYVLNYLEGYRIPFTERLFQKTLPKEKILPKEETKIIQIEIDKLLRKDAIEHCEYCECQFLSSYFLVPKPDGSNRFIFNLKKLNKFIKFPHFKLENIRSTLNLISPGYFMDSLDFKNAL